MLPGKRKRLSAWAIALIVVGVAVFGAIGAAGFMMHQKRVQADASEDKPADAEGGEGGDGAEAKPSEQAVTPSSSATAAAKGSTTAAADADKSSARGSVRQGSVRQGSVRQGSVRQGSARGNSLNTKPSNSSAVTADVAPQENATKASVATAEG